MNRLALTSLLLLAGFVATVQAQDKAKSDRRLKGISRIVVAGKEIDNCLGKVAQLASPSTKFPSLSGKL